MGAKRQEAAHYEPADEGRVRCLLCPHNCFVRDGGTGICGVRRAEAGKLWAESYGEYTSLALDPIEKKPLYHFYPGAGILSIGSRGCNLKCEFCQNSGISQGSPRTEYIGPEELAELCRRESDRSIGLAYTYNEPFIWFEFIRDSAPLIRANGQKVALVTNGFVNPGPLERLLPDIDAMNIDLKAFDDGFYKKYTGGGLEPVKETIEAAHDAGVHVEVTLLLIPTLNDGPEQLRAQAAWIASVSKDIPFHISRYFPHHRMKLPATPVKTLESAHKIAAEHLNHVYLGNTGDPEYSRTRCASCGETLIERHGYATGITGLKDGDKCGGCGARAAVVNVREDKS